MLSFNDKMYLKDILFASMFRFDNISPENINTAVNYVLTDASAIYQCFSEHIYSDVAVYSAIELSLYRAGFSDAAEDFRKETEKLPKRIFENVRRNK